MMVYFITTRDNTVHALLANVTVTWQTVKVTYM